VTNINIDPNAIAAFCRKWNVAELALFGSVLTSDFRDDSDVDVLVSFHPDAHIGLIALSKMELELSAIVGRKVDLITKGGLKPFVRDHILSSSETLYAA